MFVTLDCSRALLVRLKLSSDGATLVARNANQAVVAPVVGVWRRLCMTLSGVRQSMLCLCVCLEFAFSRRNSVFTFNV